MWFPVVGMFILHISIADVDHDGISNHLLISQSQYGYSKYAISISTEKPLPFKLNQWFKAKVNMECSKVSTLIGDKNKARHGDWGTPAIAFICNAENITVNGIKYNLSPERKKFYEQREQRQRSKHLQRKEENRKEKGRKQREW